MRFSLAPSLSFAVWPEIMIDRVIYTWKCKTLVWAKWTWTNVKHLVECHSFSFHRWIADDFGIFFLSPLYLQKIAASTTRTRSSSQTHLKHHRHSRVKLEICAACVWLRRSSPKISLQMDRETTQPIVGKEKEEKLRRRCCFFVCQIWFPVKYLQDNATSTRNGCVYCPLDII